MERRTLGRTNIAIGEIGLGTEHLLREVKEMDAVLGMAVDAGVNYLDLLYIDPLGDDATFWEPFAPALQSRREGLVLAAHWGGGPRFDIPYSHQCFEDLLVIIGDYAEVAMMTMVDDEAKWSGWAQESLEHLRRYQQQGRVGFIGASSHNISLARKMVESGLVDVLMFQANPVRDVFVDGVAELFQTCREHNVGLVGMKPYDGGTLLILDGEQTGITPVQCLAYALSLPLSVALPGPRTADELRAGLHYVESSAEEKDYGGIVDGVLHAFEGHCVYCNHCLPCPAGIDIGSVLRLKDWAKGGLSDELREWYGGLEAKASACVACGECIERCPFGVDVIEQMERAAEVFGS
jgi:predicted aldo/keto reductase-like oxidoreductase